MKKFITLIVLAAVFCQSLPYKINLYKQSLLDIELEVITID